MTNTTGTGRHSVGSDVRRGIAALLYAHANGACQVCGEATVLSGRPTSPDAAQVAHVVGEATGGRYAAGNLINACRSCNVAQERAGINDLTPYVGSFANPVILATFPAPKALKALGGKPVDVATAHADKRKALGLPF